MAELSTLARPYAKAAFEFAMSNNSLSDWSQQLSMAAAVATTDVIGKVLASPSLTTKQQWQIFVDVCGDELGGVQQNFLRVLADNKRLGLLSQIHEQFEEFKSLQERSIDLDIKSAFELDAEVTQKLTSALSTKLARDVKVQTEVDKSLLGGVIIRAGDLVIDGSLRGRLAKLAEAMNS